MGKSYGLRQQFFLIAAAGVILLGLAISIAVGIVAGNQVKRDLGHELAELAFHMGDKFDRGMWSRQGELSILVDMEQLRDPTDPKVIRRLLDRLQASVPLFSWVGFLDPAGNVLASTGGALEGQNISHRPVYSKAREAAFIGDVHDAKLLAALLPNPSGELMRFVDLSYPVRGAKGRLSGVLAAHLSWEWAREIENSLIGSLRDRDDVELFILDRQGQVLLSPKGGGTFDDMRLRSFELAKTDDRGWLVETWPDGRDYLTGYARELGHQTYPGLGWTILARQPVDSAFQPVRRLQSIIAVIGGVFAIAFVIAFWFLAGTVTRPLNALADAADQLAENGEGVLPQLDGTQEIRRLSASLRALVLSLTSSERRAQSLQDLAHRDRLTGLANRAALDAVLEHLLPEAQRSGHPVACLYMDLDGFKPVNDTLGHQAGDRVLQEVARRLRIVLRGQDVAVRLGGDEFLAIVISETGDWRTEAQACANRIIAALREPMDVDGKTVRIGASVGIAAWPQQGDDFTKVIAHADEALYAAKRAGKNRAEIWD